MFLYHDKKRSRTFHPKIYLFSNVPNNNALLIIGSSNWSAGGFHDNIEANVIIELDLKDAEQ
jgi:HKD family nuclease